MHARGAVWSAEKNPLHLIRVVPADTRIAGLSGLLVLGVGLGLLREWTGRLDACILVHAIFNVFNLLLAMTVE